ncbi:MAG: hypothetical protein H6742_22065 [Alphaproteobacteria bacterium]|nr:hypothetical protein [Alphaproteobacteria bacterium]
MVVALFLILLSCGDDKDGCEIVAEEYEAELARIQSCDVAEDCGLPLPGTGCGCDDNLVARDDADTEQLYYILQLQQDLQCELVPGPSDDCECGEPVGYRCDDGTCTWAYEEG